jgi:chitinase
MGLLLLLSVFTGIVTLGLTTAATPASATTITQCIDPASGGTSQNFVEGTAATYSVECEGESGVSGTTAYPSAITISSGSLPSSGDLTLASACTQSTSGSGTTEQYILTCKITGTPSSADAGSYPLQFTPTASPNGGTATASGTLTLSVIAPTVTCIDPASAGTATTFHEAITTNYTVECESQSGIASVSAYPTSIAIASGALPGDASQTFATSTSSSPACTTGTSGSSTTEEYILECNLSGTPTSSDGGAYPFTFTATSVGGYSSVTSGTLTVTVAAITPTCIDPATAGTATTFYEGSAGSYTVECEAQSGVSGTTAYPSSIAINSGSLPADGNPTFATSTSSSPACTTGTSGSGATEEYILECALADTPTSADTGSYPLTFTATGPGGLGSVTSGTLTVTVTPPSTTCSTPAAAGTSVSWVDGTAETETITCYSQGFATANAGNYPSSITVNSGSLPSGSSEATSLSSSPACTTATSGSGTAEEYELECKVTDTPTSANNGTYHVTFAAAGGASGAPSITSGTLTITVAQPAPSWATDGSTDGNYFSAVKGVPFCDTIEVSAGQVGPSGTNPGTTASLPLTSLTAGTTPNNVTNYSIQDVNLTTGSAEICGTNNNNVASAPVTMAPVATNTGGSSTDSVPLWSQNECSWSTSGTSTSDSLFDSNQDLYQAGSQSAFGQPITNGEVPGSSDNAVNCAGGVGVSASGGLGDAWTINSANPLPTPTDTNPSAADGDLPSSNLDLTSASSGSKGGCWGAVNILASTSTTTFVSSSAMTTPSSWVNGGDCTYGGLGSNSAGGNTDTTP